jgi:hypothetical protein
MPINIDFIEIFIGFVLYLRDVVIWYIVWVRFPLRVLKKSVIVLLINTLQAFFIVVARPLPDNFKTFK